MTNISLETIIGSAVLAAFVGGIVANQGANRLKQKELIAGATRSALERVEMYYRVRRRLKDESDAHLLRDRFHQIQEENDYYKALLHTESVWLGHSYARFISGLKRITMPHLQKAWEESGMGPSAQLEDVEKPNYEKIEKLSSQFAKDGRRFFNPLWRIVMRAKYILRKYIREDGYDT